MIWLKKHQLATKLWKRPSTKIYGLNILLFIIIGSFVPDMGNRAGESNNSRFPDLTLTPPDTLQLTDSIPLTTPDYWRQTSGIQQLGNFVIITDLVLQDAHSIWADNILTVINRRSRRSSTINVQQLPGDVPGKGFYGALPLDHELLISYSGAFAHFEPGKDSIDRYFPETFEQQHDVFPFPFLCKLAAVDDEHYLAPVISYATNQVDFAVCDTAGRISRLLNRSFDVKVCQSCPAGYKPLFSDYDQERQLHAALLTEQRQIFIRLLESESDTATAQLDLNKLLEKAFQAATFYDQPPAVSMEPIGMCYKGDSLAILVQSSENRMMKYLMIYDLRERSARAITIQSTDTFAFSWDGSELVSLSFAMPGEQRWVRFWGY